jgi:hypothetical protein
MVFIEASWEAIWLRQLEKDILQPPQDPKFGWNNFCSPRCLKTMTAETTTAETTTTEMTTAETTTTEMTTAETTTAATMPSFCPPASLLTIREPLILSVQKA